MDSSRPEPADDVSPPAPLYTFPPLVAQRLRGLLQARQAVDAVLTATLDGLLRDQGLDPARVVVDLQTMTVGSA